MNLDLDMCLSSDRVAVREYYPLEQNHHTAVVSTDIHVPQLGSVTTQWPLNVQVYASTDSLSGHLSPCCYFCPLHACK